MSIFKNKKRNRACVIGLDGVPYTMLVDLAGKGVMSTAARLIDSGYLHRMKASLPEISAVSWTNFMTGKDSGAHGIFGFTDFKLDSYEVRIPNSLDIKTKTFWDVLGEMGKKSIIINQPSTYPARKLNGILVSGFPALDMAKAVYPPAYRIALEQMGYQIDIDTVRSQESPEFLWLELVKTMAGLQKALNFFWNEEWDYFEFVITGTDRLHHFLWNAYEDTTHTYHPAFLDYYRQVDQIIETIFTSYRKMTGGEGGLYILSDHGCCGIEQEVYLNAWLEQAGYLKFTIPSPEGLENISAAETKAFALDPNRVYLNLRKKFPSGSVDASEKKVLKTEIAGKLEKLEHEGRKVVRKVFMAEDVYSGPYASKGPDLVILGERGFDMKGSVKKKEIFGCSNLQGMHTWDDAFFLADSEVGKDLAIQDLAGIILKNFS